MPAVFSFPFSFCYEGFLKYVMIYDFGFFVASTSFQAARLQTNHLKVFLLTLLHRTVLPGTIRYVGIAVL